MVTHERTHARSYTRTLHRCQSRTTETGSDSEVMADSTEGLLEEAAVHTVGTFLQRPVSPSSQTTRAGTSHALGGTCLQLSAWIWRQIRPLDEHPPGSGDSQTA